MISRRCVSAARRRRSVNHHWRTILLIVLDRDHVTPGACAVRWGRGADGPGGRDAPIRGATAIGPRRRSGRRGDATTTRADVPARAVGVGGARRKLPRARVAGTESHASLARVTADLVLVAVVDHHLEAIVVTDFQSDVPAHLGPIRLRLRDRTGGGRVAVAVSPRGSPESDGDLPPSVHMPQRVGAGQSLRRHPPPEAGCTSLI